MANDELLDSIARDYGLPVQDRFGRFQVGGPIGMGDIKNQFLQDPAAIMAGYIAASMTPLAGDLVAAEETGRAMNRPLVKGATELGVVTDSPGSRGAEIGLNALGVLPFIPAMGGMVKAAKGLPMDEASRMARADPALDAALRDYRKAFSESENIPLTNAKADVYNVLSEEGIMDSDILMALREGDESLIDEYLEKIGDRRGWAWILEEHQYDDVLEQVDYPEDIFDIARMAKGTTDDLNEAGYILPNGDWLDFSGKRQGGPWGQRAEDHRQLGFDMGGESGTDDMILFQKEGAVRIDANAGSADMEVRPTSKQLDDIQYLVERKGEGYIDLADGNRRATINIISNPNKLKGYIRRFYDGEDIGDVKI